MKVINSDIMNHDSMESVNRKVNSMSEYHCGICKKTFKRFIIFEGHFSFNAKCRSQQIFIMQCYICDKEFRHLASLKYHQRKHSTNITKQRNLLCTGEADSKEILKQSNKINATKTAANVNKKPNVRRHQCKLCNVRFSGSKRLAEHHLNIHTNGKFKCQICRTRFTYISLINHERRSHPELIKQKEILKELSKKHEAEQKRLISEAIKLERGKCTVCKMFCSDKKRLEDHMKVHTEGTLKCEICKIPFTKNSLAYHEKRHHPELLQEKFLSKELYKKHAAEQRRQKLEALKLKNGKRCSMCKKICSDSKRLEDHMKVHTEGDLECQICKIPFTKRALVFHNSHFHIFDQRKNRIFQAIERNIGMTENTDEGSQLSTEKSIEIQRIYKRLKVAARSGLNCIICKYKCKNSKTLDAHMSVHILGKFKCEICRIWFTQESLMYHERRFHPQVRKERLLKARETAKENKSQQSCVFRCSFCQIVCLDKKKLEDHLKVHTEGDRKCEICKVRFTKVSLLYHQRRFHTDRLRKERILQALERNVMANITMNTSTDEIKDSSVTSSLMQCVICKSFYDKKCSDKHMKIHIDGTYKCEICQIWFTKQSLAFHENRFHPELLKKERIPKTPVAREVITYSNTRTPIQCEICNMQCSDMNRLNDHKKVHLEGELFQCEICNIPFTKHALVCHERRFHPELRTEKHFKVALERNASRLDCSQEKAHNSGEVDACDKSMPNTNQNQCKICKLFCSTWKTLVKHMKVHVVGKHECEICQIWFTKNSLLIHLKRRHPNRMKELFLKAHENFVSKKKSGGKPHNLHERVKKLHLIKCEVCKLYCKSRKRFDDHMKVHTEGDYECAFCKIPFTKRALEIHLRRFHPVQRNELLSNAIQNNVSEKQFQQNYEYLEKIDKNGRVIKRRFIKCNICKISCPDKSKLDDHMKVHTEGDLECKICKIPFTHASLAYHEKRFHSELLKERTTSKSIKKNVTKTDGRSQYNCNICNKSFAGIVCLKRHIRLHTPYLDDSNEFCELRTIFTSFDDRHFTNHADDTQGASYQCYQCQKYFTEINQLNDHLNKHTNTQYRQIFGNQPWVSEEMFDQQDIIEAVEEKHESNQIFTVDEVVPSIAKIENHCQFDQNGQNDQMDMELRTELKFASHQTNSSPLVMSQDEVIDISSDSDSDSDVQVLDNIDAFHCYYCNKLFQTLQAVGAHESSCPIKVELFG